MTSAILETIPTRLCVRCSDSTARPAWVERLFAAGATTIQTTPDRDLSLRITETEGLVHLQVILADAEALEPAALERRVRDIYALIRAELASRRACHPLRFWNFVPGIHRPVCGGLSHYEVFNAGRYAAFSDWYGTPSLSEHMVAASGVGHRSSDFLVQVLAGERPGRGLENPRQRAAYRYSKRYGPLPPCFARATLVDGWTPGDDGRWLIVSGTASVVGEDSFHEGQLKQQLIETCANLTSLLEHAGVSCHPLARFDELRVYLVDETYRESLVGFLAAKLPNLNQLEMVPADLCRSDLMVEVEGLVRLR